MSEHAIPIPADWFEALVRQAAERVSEQRDAIPVTKEQLAKRYGVGERTIKTWRRKGLPGHAVGREVMFIPLETDRWIEQHPDREGMV